MDGREILAIDTNGRDTYRTAVRAIDYFIHYMTSFVEKGADYFGAGF